MLLPLIGVCPRCSYLFIMSSLALILDFVLRRSADRITSSLDSGKFIGLRTSARDVDGTGAIAGKET